ncbi:hypothetical protein MTR67_051579, partial [Solanum verrucosum]
MLNKVTQNDDGGKVDAPGGCLSIFLHPGRPNVKINGRYLSNKEWDAARTRQQTPFSQNVGAQQETPTQDVSPEQMLASFKSSNPHTRYTWWHDVLEIKWRYYYLFDSYQTLPDHILEFRHKKGVERRELAQELHQLANLGFRLLEGDSISVYNTAP